MEKLAEESELHRNFLLPPLPIQPASQQYEANFRATMGIVGSEVKQISSFHYLVMYLGPQSFWDATIVHSVTIYCSNLVVCTHTYFHVKQNLGISEHLAHCYTAIDNEQGVQEIPGLISHENIHLHVRTDLNDTRLW